MAEMDEQLLREWQAAGLDARDVTAWSRQGFTLFETIAWRTVRFDARDAAHWDRHHFTPYDALEWRRRSFTAAEADRWRTKASQRGRITPTRAAELRAQGVTPDNCAAHL